MPTVTFILGLCGSGKTWLAERLHEQTGARLFDEPIGRNQEPEIVQCLRDGRDCIVEELFYCVDSHRQRILAMLQGVRNLEIRFICYDNNIDASNANVRVRTNKGRVQEHLDLNQRVSPHYSFPEDCVRRPIFRIS